MKRKAMPDSPLAALGVKKKTSRTKTAAKPKGKAASTGDKRARTVYLPPELDRRLRLHAAELDRTVSDVIADAVAAFLKGKR